MVKNDESTTRNRLRLCLQTFEARLRECLRVTLSPREMRKENAVQELAHLQMRRCYEELDAFKNHTDALCRQLGIYALYCPLAIRIPYEGPTPAMPNARSVQFYRPLTNETYSFQPFVAEHIVERFSHFKANEWDPWIACEVGEKMEKVASGGLATEKSNDGRSDCGATETPPKRALAGELGVKKPATRGRKVDPERAKRDTRIYKARKSGTSYSELVSDFSTEEHPFTVDDLKLAYDRGRKQHERRNRTTAVNTP